MPIFGGKRKKDINNLDKANSASPPLRDLQSSSNPTRYEPLINPQSILQTSSNNLSQPNNFQQQQQSDIQPSSRPNQQQPSSLSSSSNNIANVQFNNSHTQNQNQRIPNSVNSHHHLIQQQQQQQQQQQLSNHQSSYPPPITNNHNGIDSINTNINQSQSGQSKSVPSSLSSSSSTVIYPWSHRRLGLLPPAPFPGDQASELNPISLSKSSPPPFPRYGHSVNSMGTPNGSGDLYIFAGLVSDQVKNDLYVLNVNNTNLLPSSSTNNPSIPSSSILNSSAAALHQNQVLTVGVVETRGEVPLPRVGHASVGVGNVLIVWGGDTKTREDQKQDDGLYLLNLSTREWTRVKVSGQSPEGRYGHSAAIIGSKFYIFGGQTDNGSFMNDLWAFDLHRLKSGSPRWQFVEIPPNAPAPSRRTGHTVVTHTDSIFVFGGTDGQYHYNDTWKFDAVSGTWTELDCIGYIPLPREGHSATLVDDVMYVLGGRGVDGKDLDDLAAFKISNQRWYMFQNMGPAPAGRSGHAMATWQGKVYVLGGESYTSSRPDDPSIVHVLDTGKIKYPPDPSSSSRQAQQNAQVRKISSNPAFNSQQIQEGLNPNNQTRNGLPNGSSAPSSSRNQNSNTMESTNGADAFRNPKRSTTGPSNNVPVRPRRDDDPISNNAPNGGIINRRTMAAGPSASPQSQVTNLINESMLARRSMSPSSTSHSKNASLDSSYISHSNLGPNSKPPRPLTTAPLHQSVIQQQQQQQARQTSSPLLAGRSSSEANRLTNNMSPPMARQTRGSPSDSNLTGASPLGSSKDQARLLQLQKNNVWMKAALAMAVKQGFALPESDDLVKPSDGNLDMNDKAWLEKFQIDDKGSGGLKNRNVQKFVETLVQLKRELNQAKGQIVEQTKMLDDRFTEVNRAKTVALQEASFYRVKLAAYEASSVSEINKLERERISDLEHKLSEIISCKSGLERQVNQLTNELEHERTLRELSEENAQKSHERSQEIEALHSRSLVDYEELLNKTKGLDLNSSRSVEELDTLNLNYRVVLDELESYKSKVKLAESSNQQYLSTLEQLQKTLGVTNSRIEEVEKFWNQSKNESEMNRNLTIELNRELEGRLQELNQAQSRTEELERLLESLKEENESLRTLNEKGISELVETTKSIKSLASGSAKTLEFQNGDSQAREKRDEPGDGSTRAALDATLVELTESRTRNTALERDLMSAKSELSIMRTRLSGLVQETNKIRNEMSRREFDLKEKNRLIEAAEVKASLMKNLIGESGTLGSAANGAVDDIGSRSFESSHGVGPSSMGGSLLTSIGNGLIGEGASTEQLTKKVLELQNQLDQRNRSQRELERQQEETAREIQTAEERYREAHRKHEAAAEEIALLVEEVQRLRSGGASSVSPASAEGGSTQQGKVEEELQALQERHRTLESTHIKAVQYVKGTEKMLRRMKEELSKYKEKTEQLELELSRARQQSPPLMMRDRMNELNGQIESLRMSSKRSTLEQEELKTKMSLLKQEYESSIEKLENEKIEEVMRVKESIKILENENMELREDLKKFIGKFGRDNVGDVNNKISRGTGSGDGDGKDGEDAELRFKELKKQSEVLRKENLELQNRCRDAESKISLLLDHMENHSDGNAG